MNYRINPIECFVSFSGISYFTTRTLNPYFLLLIQIMKTKIYVGLYLICKTQKYINLSDLIRKKYQQFCQWR